MGDINESQHIDMNFLIITAPDRVIADNTNTEGHCS